ncbi:MAG TPA: hypothetical protein VF624_02115 [Tepidisphaeraceae bacterium]|jgi:hypothetical protein
MTATAGEDEQLAQLLGEALRRGPGSPEWHDALARTHDGSAEAADETADETQRLLAARDRLGRGKDYRSVRAGPAFTEAVFANLDAPSGRPRSMLLTLIAAGCAAAVMVSVAMILIVTSRARTTTGDELARQLFITPLHAYAFLRPDASTLALDPSWHIDRGSGLRPAAPAEAQRLELPTALDLTRPVCVECVVTIARPVDTKFALSATGGGSGGPRIEMELSRSAVTASHNNDTVRVRREMRPGTAVLRLKLARDHATAEVDGKPVWDGPIDFGESARLAIEFRGVGRETAALRLEAVRVLGTAPGGESR